MTQDVNIFSQRNKKYPCDTKFKLHPHSKYFYRQYESNIEIHSHLIIPGPTVLIRLSPTLTMNDDDDLNDEDYEASEEEYDQDSDYSEEEEDSEEEQLSMDSFSTPTRYLPM